MRSYLIGNVHDFIYHFFKIKITYIQFFGPYEQIDKDKLFSALALEVRAGKKVRVLPTLDKLNEQGYK